MNHKKSFGEEKVTDISSWGQWKIPQEESVSSQSSLEKKRRENSKKAFLPFRRNHNANKDPQNQPDDSRVEAELAPSTNRVKQHHISDKQLPLGESTVIDSKTTVVTNNGVQSAEETIKNVARVLEELEKQSLEMLKQTGSVRENTADSQVELQSEKQATNADNTAATEEVNNSAEQSIDENMQKAESEKLNAALKELDIEILENELKRYRYRKRYRRIVRSTINGLVVTAAFAVLVAMLWLPVLQIYGSSMTPAMSEGDVVVTVKDSHFETGDLVAFYYGNKLLVKRCIAGPTDWIDIDKDGYVKINGKKIDEPYVSERALGECDLEFPYQVPEEHWFLMGDHRKTSVDSRSKTIGSVSKEQIVGKVFLRVWPLNKLSWLA